MKYLLKYNSLFENKVVDQLINKYQKMGKTIDDSDLEYFKKVTKKLPNNLPRLVKWVLEGEEPSEVSVVYDFYQDLRDKNLKVPDINQFEKSEDLYDALQEVERKYKVNKMVQEFPSNLKREYKRMSDTSELDNMLFQLNQLDTKGELISKISRYKNIEDLKNVLNSFLSSSSNDYKKTLISLKSDPNVEVTYFKDNIIIAKIKDYESSCEFGSKSWCISTSSYYFDSYIRDSLGQYFIWDFNLPQTNKLSLIGVTLNNFRQCIMAISIRGQLNTAHDRYDNYIGNEIENILRDKNIPLNTIFLSEEGNEEKIFNILIKFDNMREILEYLSNNSSTKMRDRVFKHISENGSEYKKFEINLALLCGYKGEKKLSNKYFNKDTIENRFREFAGKDPGLFLKNKLIDKYYCAEVSKYYKIILSEYSTIIDLFNELESNNQTTNSITKIITDSILNKIKSMEDINTKVSFLFTWKREYKPFNIKAKNYLRELIKNNLNELNTNNKIDSYLTLKKGYEASKELKNIEYKKDHFYIVERIFTYRPLSNNKTEYLNNIIDFLKHVDIIMLTSSINNAQYYYYPAFKYMGKKIFDFYNIVDHTNRKRTENYEFGLAIFKNYDNPYDEIRPINKYLKSELGFKIIEDYKKYTKQLIGFDKVIRETFKLSTKKQLNKHKDLIDFIVYKFFHKHNIETIYSLIYLGDEKYMDIVYDYMSESKYVNILSEILSAAYISKKITMESFKKIVDFCIKYSKKDTTFSFLYTIIEKVILRIYLIQGNMDKIDYIISVILKKKTDMSKDELMDKFYDQIISNIYDVNKSSDYKNLIKRLHKHKKIDKKIILDLHEKDVNVKYKKVYNVFKSLYKNS